MAEAFARPLNGDHVGVNTRADAQTVTEQLVAWLDHHTEGHLDRALGYRSPREFIALIREAISHFRGNYNKWNDCSSSEVVETFGNPMGVMPFDHLDGGVVKRCD